MVIFFVALFLNRRQREHLRIFEKECLNEYLHLLKETERKDISNRAQCIQEKYHEREKSEHTFDSKKIVSCRVDSLAKAFDEDRNKRTDHQSNEKQSANVEELQKIVSNVKFTWSIFI